MTDDLFGQTDFHDERSLLDSLLTDSKLYHTTKAYKELLDFVVRLRNFAPFNAMLLQIQKPGLSYAASRADWWVRFQRRPKEGARPLLILWPFGPVALVYDVMDTEGKDLPEGVASFVARGPIGEQQISDYRGRAAAKNIRSEEIDAGDGRAGSILCERRAAMGNQKSQYRMLLNRNHKPPVRFATIAHELAHLFLGHLGPDKALHVPERPRMDHPTIELEAESAAFVVCARNGVESESEKYLAAFVSQNTMIGDLDIYQIMRAAGQVETLLGLGAKTRFTTD